jgi:hypothetical protein
MGAIQTKQLSFEEQFPLVNDLELKKHLIRMSDFFDNKIKGFVYSCYTDPELLGTYKAIRDRNYIESKLKQKSSSGREVVRYPNQYVYDFINTVIGNKYGENWRADKSKYLKIVKSEELFWPWLVVERSSL